MTGRGSGNSRNGTRPKTVLTGNVGPVQIEVPRDRDGSFDPVIVKKRQRRLGGVDTISRITDRVLTEMAEWMARSQEMCLRRDRRRPG